VDPATLDALPAPDPEAPEHDAADDPFGDPLLGAAWRDALVSLADVAEADGRVRRGAVLATLRDALRAETARDAVTWGDPGPSASGPGAESDDLGGAVTLRPLEALADVRVRHVLLLGAVDGSLPRPTPDDPVLGFHERAALSAAGVPLRGAGDLARGEALRFWGAWRAAGERLWLGVPAQTGRDARLPSPFLARLGVVAEASGEPPPSSPQAFRAAALRAVDEVPDAVDPVLAHARRAHAQALAREAEPRWGPDDGFAGIGVDPAVRRWSATQLTDLGTCRFKWWVGRVWGVSAPEEGATELTPLLEGRLYHAALDGALQAAVGRSGAEARRLAAAALDAAFAEAERAEGIADVVPHWARRREDHLAHLRALVGAEAFLPDGHEVLALERWFRGEWEGWRVVGRVDRVDRSPEGVRLIDYKLGSGRPLGARDAELAPTLDLQLPLYVEVAAPQVAPGESVAGAVYLSLRKMTEVRAKPPERHELDDLFTRLREALRAGFFPVEPHPDVCRRCDFDLVCRKGPHLDRKPSTHRVPPTGADGTASAGAADASATHTRAAPPADTGEGAAR
ncbi:MAG: PD-(D/E)XK nuclease family protein, partial [Trueperaceae bacterium]|nr:PD-(D/E)XK nuclease family protein [Trueperaceae bacterium]